MPMGNPGGYEEGIANLTPEELKMLGQGLRQMPQVAQLLAKAFPEAMPLLQNIVGAGGGMNEPDGDEGQMMQQQGQPMPPQAAGPSIRSVPPAQTPY